MAHRAPVVVAPYSDEWPQLFEAEREALMESFEAKCSIEHIGSTAVPGLAAKPIIDMMLGIVALADLGASMNDMRDRGYAYLPEAECAVPDRRFFAKPVTRPRQFHLHVVAVDGAFWKRHLAFRDALRGDRDLARSYASLKGHLAARFGDDREGYTNAKGPFIQAVVTAAMRNGPRSGSGSRPSAEGGQRAP